MSVYEKTIDEDENGTAMATERGHIRLCNGRQGWAGVLQGPQCVHEKAR